MVFWSHWKKPHCCSREKSAANFHDEMNFKHYEEWFRRILKLIPDKSAILIDRVPYDTVQDPATRYPISLWKNYDKINWIIDHKIEPAIGNDGYQEIYESFTKDELISYGLDDLNFLSLNIN
jgi:hypothetical protein